MANSIEIDGILFTLLCKSEADNLLYRINKTTRVYEYERHQEAGRKFIHNVRDIVKFRSTSSTGVVKILYAYRSTSELGIWRLGYLEPRSCGLNKFSLDYIQGTLLHHLLQNLINENFESLPFISEDESGTKLVVDALPEFKGKLPPENVNLTKEEINDEKFRERHKFILLEFPKYYGIVEGHTEEDHALVIDDSKRKLEIAPFSSIDIKSDTRTEETNIRTELGILSSKIESEYELDIASNTHIFTYPFQEPNEDIYDCVISMYTVNLLNKSTPETLKENVILVYCKYNMKYSIERTPASGCYGIALLKSSESAVNEYGLYSHFIDAGIYICKPIVYSSGFIVDENFNEEDRVRRGCGLLGYKDGKQIFRYIFVGDRYENVFPYNKLHELLSSGGMRKPRFKRKTKKIQKYKKSKTYKKYKKSKKSKKSMKSMKYKK